MTTLIKVCDASSLQKTGDYVALTAAHDTEELPILVVMGDDGVIRAFKNICKHRHIVLVDVGEGNSCTHTCPFHGWTYDLQGRLCLPSIEGDDILPPAALSTKIRLDEYEIKEQEGQVFIVVDA